VLQYQPWKSSTFELKDLIWASLLRRLGFRGKLRGGRK